MYSGINKLKIISLLVAFLLFISIIPLVSAFEFPNLKQGLNKELQTKNINQPEISKIPNAIKELKIVNKDKTTVIQATYPKIDPSILSYEGDEVPVIIESNVDMPNSQKFQFGNFYATTIKKSEIENLANNLNIIRISLDYEVKPLLDVSVPLINADDVWSAGYNGSSVKVCVLDTGINSSHPAFQGAVIASQDFTGSGTTLDIAGQWSGHGTHVAGIIASRNSTYKGIAPNSSILNAKVCTGDGCSWSWIMNGMDWCVNQGASVLSISIGGPQTPNDGSDALSSYSDSIVDQGKVVVIAAGNNGPNASTVTCPGCAHKVITVGATYKQSYSGWDWGSCTDTNPSQDQIVCFSSRGPTNDSRIKPDLVAPGAIIRSANAGWESDGLWRDMSGTSMATPMVSGVSALILQARPNISPEELKALLMDSTYNYNNFGKNNTYGAGRVDALKAFNERNYTKTALLSSSGYNWKAHNIYVPSGTSEIRATLYWPESYTHHNDLDLYLLDPSGNTRADSISGPNTDEMVRVANPGPAGYWKLVVYPYDVSGTQEYAVASNLQPSEQFNMLVDNTSSIVFHELTVTNSSQPLKVNLDWNDSSINFDLYLYNTTFDIVNISNSTSSNHEEVSFNNPETGTWYIKIKPNSSTDYSVTSTSSISGQYFDTSPPEVWWTSPWNNSYSNDVQQNVSAYIWDDWSNVDKSSLIMDIIANDNNGTYTLSSGQLEWISNWVSELRFHPSQNWSNNDVVNVTVHASDNGENAMEPYFWTFTVDTQSPTVNMSFTNNETMNEINPSLINITASDNQALAVLWHSIWDDQNNKLNLKIFDYYLAGNNITLNKSWDGDGFILTNGTHSSDLATVIKINDTPFYENYTINGYYKNSTNETPAWAIFDPTSLNLTGIFDYYGFVTIHPGDTFKIVNYFDSPIGNWSYSNSTTLVITSSFKLVSVSLNDSHTFTLEAFAIDYANNIGQDHKYNVMVGPDPPTWSNNITNPSSPANYVINNTYWFNITWTDNGIVDKAILEFNGTNYTASNNGNVYYKIITDLAVGDYSYKWYANDSRGIWNSTEELLYTVNKGTPPLVLASLPSWQVTVGTQTNVTCSSNNQIANLTLYRNSVEVNMSSNPVSDIQTLGVESYNYNCTSEQETANYTIGSTSNILTVSAPPLPGPSPGPSGAAESQGGGTPVTVFKVYTPDNLTIEPGKSVSFTAKITNEGTIAPLLTVSLTGIPESWYTITGNSFILDLASSKDVPITITVPSNEEGTRTISLTVASRSTSVTNDITLEIKSLSTPPPAQVTTPPVSQTPTGFAILFANPLYIAVMGAIAIAAIVVYRFRGRIFTRRPPTYTSRRLAS